MQFCISVLNHGVLLMATLQREATDKFIEITHDQYLKHNGKHFGNNIHGVFTDEPHRGGVMCNFGINNKSPEYLTPTTEKLFEVFQETFGYDLVEHLPELFLWKDGEKISPVKWQYMELLQRLFLENYLKPLQQWCHQHNMLLTGHLLHEDSLTAQTCMLGSMIRSYEYMDVPGVDVLTEFNGAHWIVKQLQSAARQLGKRWMLSELYGCTGWQMSFENHKAVGDWQALFGINLRCPHLSWYSMKGEAKRDCPGSIFYQSAWYPQYHYIEDYYSRLHVLLERGEPVCDLLVVYPVESLWAGIYPRWAWMLGAQDEDVQRLEGIYADTFRRLCAAKIDFDYGDEDILSRLASVQTENGVPALQVGKMRYRTVLVSGMLTMRSSTLCLLKEFQKAGGQVVFSGERPVCIDAVRSTEANMLDAVDTTAEELIAVLSVKPLAHVTDENGNIIEDIYAQVRKDHDDYIAVLMNLNREQPFHNATVSFDIGGYCEKWDVRTGKRALLAQGTPLEFRFDFEPLTELCIVITAQDNQLPVVSENRLPVKSVSFGKQFSYYLHEPNVCVLDFADVFIDGNEWKRHCEILRADKAIREKFGLHPRGGNMLQPWFVGETEQLAVCSLKLKFQFHIVDFPKYLKLAVETPEKFRILVNGQDALKPVEGDYWVDSCFSIFSIDPNALKCGQNIITMECDFRHNVDLEAIYLLGDFGVTLDGSFATLTQLPDTISMGDLTAQGFPFYGAGISYFVDAPVVQPGQNVQVVANDFEAACILVKNGKQEKLIWSQPYRTEITELLGNGEKLELQYILTRRNTFGPLHYAGGRAPAYDSGTFMADGELFLDDAYSILPQGMTGEVFLEVR